MWGFTMGNVKTYKPQGDPIHPSRNANLYLRVVQDEPLPSTAVGWLAFSCMCVLFLPIPSVLGHGSGIPWISS